ncbi:MAG: cupredoxin domain-containing protein [Pseudomonadota bacterium]
MQKLLLSFLLMPAISFAAEADYTLTIKDHRFQPAEFSIPAGKKIKLIVTNQDSSPEEFESSALNREKVIMGGQSGTLYIGPLDSGRYPFMGEFNQTTAQGVIVAE